jgi:hypothetical protein
MRLKHMVKDKVNFRAKGPRTQLTRQPVSGRANDGGLRIGEMERDVMIAHGATDFLRESMLDRGDQYYMAVCNKTGAIAVYNPDKNLFMSPMADGPLKFVESLDGKELNVEHVTKYGRDFSVVRVPYVFKLLMHELQTINVKMSLITEDNINQFDNMNFSNNISLLTNGSSLSPDDVMRQIKIVLKGEPAKTLGPEIEIEKEKEKEKKKEKEFKGLEFNSLGEEYIETIEWSEVGKDNLKPADWLFEDINGYEVEDWNTEGANGKTEGANGKPEGTVEGMEGREGKNFTLSGGSAEPKFEKNDVVIFAGDFKKDRRWLIRKINGNFAKIETNDFSEGLSPENATNIVELRNLKKADSLIPEPTLKPVGQLVPQGQQQQQQPAQQMPTQPVQINVVTGNNNKLTESPAIETTPMIKKPNNESNTNNVSFSEMMMSSSSDDADKIDSIPTGSKSGPIIVRKI